MTSYDGTAKRVSGPVRFRRLRLWLRKYHVGCVAACALDHRHRRVAQIVDGGLLLFFQTNHLIDQFAAEKSGLFAGKLCNLLEFFQNFAVILPAMRQHALRAVLQALFGVAAVAAAASAQRVERAVAEQTIEIVGIVGLVAGEVLTLPVLKKRVMLALPVLLHTFSTFNFSTSAASGVT